MAWRPIPITEVHVGDHIRFDHDSRPDKIEGNVLEMAITPEREFELAAAHIKYEVNGMVDTVAVDLAAVAERWEK